MISLKQTTVAIAALTGVLALGACATTPSPLSGKFSSVTPREAQSGHDQGEPVRWGGVIVTTEPGKTETCFRMLATPLGRTGKPAKATQSNFQGRFLACAKGYYEPELYARGRRVTFVGTIDGLTHEKIGKYDYPYPRIQATVVYLWPREVVHPQTNVYYMNGWWGPYGGFNWWPWWGYSTWGAPPPYYRYPDPDPPHKSHSPSNSNPVQPQTRPRRPRSPRPAGRPLRQSPLHQAPLPRAPASAPPPRVNPPQPPAPPSQPARPAPPPSTGGRSHGGGGGHPHHGPPR